MAGGGGRREVTWIQQHPNEDASAGSWNEVKQDGCRQDSAAPQRRLLDKPRNPSDSQLDFSSSHSSAHISATKWLGKKANVHFY